MNLPQTLRLWYLLLALQVWLSPDSLCPHAYTNEDITFEE